MKKLPSVLKSFLNPDKGDNYSRREVMKVIVGWSLLLMGIFLLLKFLLDWLHLDKWWSR